MADQPTPLLYGSLQWDDGRTIGPHWWRVIDGILTQTSPPTWAQPIASPKCFGGGGASYFPGGEPVRDMADMDYRYD